MKWEEKRHFSQSQMIFLVNFFNKMIRKTFFKVEALPFNLLFSLKESVREIVDSSIFIGWFDEKGKHNEARGREEEMRAHQAPYNCDSKSIDKKGLVASRSVCVCFRVHTIV